MKKYAGQIYNYNKVQNATFLGGRNEKTQMKKTREKYTKYEIVT